MITTIKEQTTKLTSDEKEYLLWLQKYFQPTKKRLMRNTSYGIKHWFENETGTYVNNIQSKKILRLLFNTKETATLSRLNIENYNEQYFMQLKPGFQIYYGHKAVIYNKEQFINSKYGGLC